MGAAEYVQRSFIGSTSHYYSISSCLFNHKTPFFRIGSTACSDQTVRQHEGRMEPPKQYALRNIFELFRNMNRPQRAWLSHAIRGKRSGPLSVKTRRIILVLPALDFFFCRALIRLVLGFDWIGFTSSNSSSNC
jgi:hypothetical protein